MWKPVPLHDYEDYYQVNEHGDIRSLHARRDAGLLASHLVNGKVMVTLSSPVGGRIKVYVHRMVAGAFLPNDKGHRFVCFHDGDATNCHVDNLFWSQASR